MTETLHNPVNRSGKGSQLVNTHTQACTHTAGDRNITQSGKQKWKGQSAGERNLAEVKKQEEEAAEHQDKQNRDRKGELTGEHLHTR